ncbi:MAG: tRNA preQ1(34) S-adenosylmethionine ribosyltransferase-isomerase QueA [Phycisphaerae bacterium]|nr:tRNA preQ1(34) S-adenosylmethionine ribosyltransferase-isomerase QueA [Phycisphaerae bacterium]
MKTEKLNYDLPSELIAQQPLRVRSDSRLLVLNRCAGDIQDSRFRRLGHFLFPGDCLVLNDTKVVPARFFARRSSGARLEGLFLDENTDGVWTVYLKGARKVRPREQLYLKDRQDADFCTAELLEKTDFGRCKLKLGIDAGARTVLERIGFPPLPPYIKRDPGAPGLAADDELRYQTVYARKAGAVAAPTAGLHFTETLIERLKHAGIRFAFITLHVGAGTFKPVATEYLEDHQIHSEQFSIDEENAGIIEAARNGGGRIVPVGTTSMRVLETVAAGSEIRATTGATELFITPGYEFKIADAMITNFHLPKSTLLALVAAFAGLENVLAAYDHAIEQQYRFYSYGDAMLIV